MSRRPNRAVRWLVVASFAAAASCSTDRPPPLDPEALLAELRAARIDVPAEGLDPVQAMALALVHHPDLVALRVEHEIAANEVVAEGAWRNPEFRPSLSHLASSVGSPVALALGLRFFPGVPGERDARVGRAQALDARAVARIADRESQVAAATRLAHARVVMLEEQLALTEAARALHARMATLVKERVVARAAKGIDAAFARLRSAQFDEELLVARAELEVARTELAALVGAPFDAPLRVRKATQEREFVEPDEAALEQAALSRRADLQVRAQEYDAQQQTLRIARLAHGWWPLFLQPSAEGDHLGHDFGLQAGFEIPLFDSGDKAIAVEEARVKQAEAAYAAQLARVRQEIHLAVLRWRAQDQRRHGSSDPLPQALDEAEQLMKAALEAGEVDAIEWWTIESRILDARRDQAQAWFDGVKARVELDLATGTVFDP